jgi:hypothetical protein
MKLLKSLKKETDIGQSDEFILPEKPMGKQIGPKALSKRQK